MDTQVVAGRPKGRRLLALFAILTLLGSTLIAAPAGAEHEDVEIPADVTLVVRRANGKVVVEFPQARVYDDIGRTDGGQANWVAVGGGSMLDVCTSEDPPPLGREIFYERPNGSYIGKTLPGGIQVEVHVYKTDMEVFSYFDAVCGAFFEQGTPIPAAFASGFATLTEKVRVRDVSEWMNAMTPQPPGSYLNGLEGVVADADGNAYDLVTVADFRVTARGTYDFRESSVTMTPAA